MMANKLSHFMVQDFVLNQFVQDFPHWRLVHQQNVIIGQGLAMFMLHGIGVTVPELRSEQYSLHDEIVENNGSGRSMGNRIGRDTVSSQLE
jgi:hypothetical protein